MRTVLTLIACLIAAPAAAEVLYVEAGFLIPVAGAEVEDGAVVIEDGKIKAAGPASEVKPPPFARRIDARDQVVMPGFVVPASRIGMPAPAARRNFSAPYRPVMEPWYLASREFYPFHPDLPRLLAAGVTTLVAVPRNSGGILGQAAALRTAPVPIEERFLEKSAALVVSVDARTAWAEAVSKAFDKTREELKKEEEKKKEAAEKKPAKNDGGGEKKGGGKKKPPPDPAKEGMRKAVQGKLPVLLVGLSAAEWETFDGAVETEGMRLVAEEGIDLWRAADALAGAKVRVVVPPVLVSEGSTNMPVNRAAKHRAAGVEVAFTLPRDGVDGAREVLSALAEMAGSGLKREEVLAAATEKAAGALGLDKRVGSIAAGREADLLFLSGDPLDPTTRIERVMARGKFVAPVEAADAR
jgi:imidazolonepropionase-like amidohydrolase